MSAFINAHLAPEDHPRGSEKIKTTAWAKPAPSNKFDWEAWFDNDEPSDEGQMPYGYGATEPEAIADLLMQTEAA